MADFSGEPREVRRTSTATVDGASLTMVVAMAAVVAVLSLIPFSAVLGVGGSFPLSQAVYPLVGWLLGPVAGALAGGVGAVVGLFVAPHTAGSLPWLRFFGAALSSFAAGTLTAKPSRRRWWMAVGALLVATFLAYGKQALANGVGLRLFLLGSFIDWSALVLYLLPTRVWVGRALRSEAWHGLAVGLFFGTWIAAGLSHLLATTVYYFLYNWPAEVWWTLVPVMPVEHLFRSAVGMALGLGVMRGMRALGLQVREV